MRTYISPGKRKLSSQGGFVLITAMIFLVILMMLGMTVVGTTSTDEKMARNSRDFDVAFSAAEAAMRDAQLLVDGSWKWPSIPVDISTFNATCANGLCDQTATQSFQPIDALDFYASTGTGSNSIRIGAITTASTAAALATATGLTAANLPRYLIEMMCSSQGALTGPCNKVFRITVQAHGRLPNTVVVLQEVYQPSAFSN